MKKTDILYLIIIMLLIYAFFSIFVDTDPLISYIEPQSDLVNTYYEQVPLNEGLYNNTTISNAQLNSIDIPYQSYYNDQINPNAVVRANTEPSINARSAIVMDFETGTILYEKNAFRKRPMASTTKIMTAILALENCSLDEDVAISKRASGMGGSSMGIKFGTVVKMDVLLHGLLICSGNDAAMAIAEHIGGSSESFCELMNQKAIEIGAFSTSFSNPHGLDAPDHYTTAYDLAKITRYALNIPEFDDIVKKHEFYFNGRTIRSTNEMLSVYEGADGVKTGYTGLAGRCLVTSATKKGMRLISVVLFCDTKNLRTSSSRKILDYSFEEYKPIDLLSKGTVMGSIKVKRSRTFQDIQLASAENLSAVIKHNQKDMIFTRISIPEIVTAPVKKGSIMGTVSIFKGDRIIAETSLITLNSAEKKEFKDYLGQVIFQWIKMTS